VQQRCSRDCQSDSPGHEALEIIKEEQVPEVLELLTKKLKELPEVTVETVKPVFKQITKELKLGGKQVFMPIRIALTGQMHGPELYDIVVLLGLENVFKRLEQAKTLL